MKTKTILTFFFISITFLNCSKNEEDEYITLQPELNEQYSGGNTTVFNESSEAFGFFATELTLDEQSDFGIGNSKILCF